MNIIANPVPSLADRIDASRNTGNGRMWHDGKLRTVGRIGRGTETLTRENLRSAVPSIFAEAKHKRTSTRYSFLPTGSILDGLEAEGWLPVMAQQQKVRDNTREGFQKHLIRFAHRDSIAAPDRPEIVLVNSHDRSSAYNLHFGIFRAVCMNGLVVCDATFARVSITHMNFSPSKVIEASVELSREIPRIQNQIEEFKGINLSESQREVFAEATLIAKYGSVEKAPVSPLKLLEPRRTEDNGTDLWKTLNVVQENVIKGGQRGIKKDDQGKTRRVKSHPVGGIDGNVNLNKALWHIAEAFKAGK